MGRMNLFPEYRLYQYFLKFLNIFYLNFNLVSILVLAPETDVEENEEQGDQGGGADADVEPGVVRKDPLLVVLGVVVKVMTIHSRLEGKVPGAKLVAHGSASQNAHKHWTVGGTGRAGQEQPGSNHNQCVRWGGQGGKVVFV